MTGEEVLRHAALVSDKFCYRDSKQFTGLMDCQARHKRQLFLRSAHRSHPECRQGLHKDNGMDNSMAKVKSLMFNANYTKLISTCPDADRTEL